MTDYFLPPDAEQRQQSLDPTQSFICEAPAGSGKTELLTQRFLTLLGRVEKPEQILAITFTRKATGEMRERILRALQDATDPQQNPDKISPHKLTTWRLARAVLQADVEKSWQLLQNPSRLRIMTFDSLASYLTQQLPLESALGVQPKVEEDARELYKLAVTSLLSTLEEDQPWTQALVTVLRFLDNRFDRFENLMVDMLARRESWLPFIAGSAGNEQLRNILAQHFQRVIEETLALVREKIPRHCHQSLLHLAAYAAANVRRSGSSGPILNCIDIDLKFSELPPAEVQYLPLWRGIAWLFLIYGGDWRKSVNSKNGFLPSITQEERQQTQAYKQKWAELRDIFSQKPQLRELLHSLRSLPRSDLDQEQWHLLQALFTLLPVAVAQLTLVFREKNTLDFVEFSLAALRALGQQDSPSALALRMDYRIQHILVDEFQDTSQIQVDLLNSLTRGWTPGDGRTVFCVGDAMQSIYSFRGARVGLFLHCREQGLANLPLTPIRLVANFRSQAGLVDWTNKVFAQSFPQEADVSSGAVEFSPSIATKEKQDHRAVYLHAFVDQEDYQAEAINIRGIIRKTRMDTPDASIAILFRSRDHVAHILPVLKQAGIDYQAIELDALNKKSVIQDLLALTRALLHSADRIAWLAILRAPWCGLTLADLTAITNSQITASKNSVSVLEQCETALALRQQPVALADDLFQPDTTQWGNQEIALLSDDGAKRLGFILPILKTALAEKDRKTFRQWIQACWLQIGGPAVVESQTDLQNAEKYFELLETWEYPSQLPGITYLLEAVEKLYAQADNSGNNPVQIMSIHKSKGLEFDVVIVPSLHRKTRSNDTAVLLWHQRLNTKGKSELLMAPLTGSTNSRHANYQYLRDQETQKIHLENCRLLYVACTRARKQLFLSAFVKQDPKDSLRLKPPVSSSLLSCIWDSVQNRMSRLDKKQEFSSHQVERPVKPRALYRLKAGWQLPDLPAVHTLDNFIPAYEYDNQPTSINHQQESNLPRHSGTVIHRYLQAFADQGLSVWSPQLIDQQTTRIRRQLSALGVIHNQLTEGTEKVLQILKNCLNSSILQKLLSTEYHFAKNEYSLTLKNSLGHQTLIMDRVFTDNQNCSWIIDYKTSEPSEEQSRDDFFKQESSNYLEKMKLYQQALAAAGHQKIKIALYFPVIDELLVLD